MAPPAAILTGALLAALGAACVGEIGAVVPRGDVGGGGDGGAGGSTEDGSPDDGTFGPDGGPLEDFCASAEEVLPGPTESSRPTFTVARGLYGDAFDLELRAEGPDDRIVYTLDGSAPADGHGTEALGTAALRVETTTLVRAIAIAPGLSPSRVETHTYLFLADVLRQPAQPAGLPDVLFDVGHEDALPLDAEMDPEVVEDPATAGEMLAALEAIPSVSIVMDGDDLFGPEGWYRNGGGQGGENGDYERGASIELLWPGHDDRALQIDAGVRGHSWVVLKRSIRLSFRQEWGAPKLRTCLLQHAPQNADTATTKLDRIVLRAGVNRAWTNYWNPDDTTYTRDQWVRDSQIALSGAGSHGTFVHVYLNGLYWGVYNAVERPDEHFSSEYLGGEDGQWFAINHGGPIDGDGARWNRLVEELAWADASDPEVWREIQGLLDVDAFADYLILNWYAGTDDWPGNNWYASIRNEPPGPLRFWAWDAEDTWDAEASSGPDDQPGGRGNDGAWVHPAFRGEGDSGPPASRLWRALRRSPEFRVRFADRVHRATGPGGALSEDASRARWMALAEAIQVAILGESARWGDAREALGERTRTRDGSWWPEVRRVHDESMPGNVARLIAALRDEGAYPWIDPPEVLASGGGAVIEDPNETGTLWVTLDGTDPRAEGGEASTSARRWEGNQTVERGTEIRARVESDGQWSALALSTVP
jgi:hypothetical protein